MADKHHSETAHSRLLPQATRYLDYFLALTEVGKVLTSKLELNEVLSTVMEALSQLLRPKNWSLLLVDKEANDLYFGIVVGEARQSISTMRLAMGEGIAGWVAQSGKPVICAKASEDPRFSSRMDAASSFQTASIAAVPLVCRGETLGVIELVKPSDEPNPYSVEDLQILQPFADFTAIAIDNARAFERIQELTIRDDWTGLYNARFLATYLEHELARAERYDSSVCIIFLDLDHFKVVNDSHGHAIGSNALKAVGEILQNLIRKFDRAIRYGGDEFVLVLPQTDKAAGLQLAERVREELNSSAINLGEHQVKITASIGVACRPENGHTADALLEAADHAMYAAKAGGRNAVVDASKS
ncbi:MAG: sensor domain-containing diguanylate cyclase [Myxococcota bacterium]